MTDEPLWTCEAEIGEWQSVLRVTSPRFFRPVNLTLDSAGTISLLSPCCSEILNRGGRAGELLICSECKDHTGFALEHSFPAHHGVPGESQAERLIEWFEIEAEPLSATLIASELLDTLFPTLPHVDTALHQRLTTRLTSPTLVQV